MKKEQEELGMEVTVKDEDIEECVNKADEIEEELKQSNAKEKEYFIFKPEVVDTERIFLS